MAAFVAAGAEAFLPDPEGLAIICWLQPGATDAPTLDGLLRRGALLFKSDRMHMKVYWSSLRGCVICSANASRAALAGSGQKEAGVLLPPGEVDIDRLWREADPREIGKADLASLARKAADAPRAPGVSSPAPSGGFMDWHMRRWKRWKLCGYRGAAKVAAASVSRAKISFGVEPYNWVDNADDDVRAGDWLLVFALPRIDDLGWLRVDFVEKVKRGDPGYLPGYEHQAVQVYRRGRHAEPFALDAKFRKAFALAVGKFGVERIASLGVSVPSAKLLNAILDGHQT